MTIRPNGLHDLGAVKQGGSYAATFTVLNSGNLDLRLTGTPLVELSGDTAGFSISQEPSTLIKVRRSSDFVLSYIPIGEGSKEILLLIQNNSKQEDFSFELTSFVDGTIPAVDVDYPQGTGVPTNTVVWAQFSEAMDPATITATTFTVLEFGESTPVGAAVTYDASTFTAYLDPSSNLDPDSYYTATLSKTITDLVGNPISLVLDHSWIFETGASADTDPPQVISTVPADSATGVALDAAVTATFNEAIDESTLTADTFKLLEGAVEVPGAVTYSAATKTATFQPGSDLDPSTPYTARLLAGIKDVVGNATALVSEWSFTTETGVDNDPPEVVARNPASGASGVATNTIISARFNEAINPDTVTGSTFTLTEFELIPVSGSVVYDSNSLTATFTPATELTTSKLFTVTLTSGIKDIAGNSLAEPPWSFTTGTGADGTLPTVDSTSPADTATDVPVDDSVTATFSEAMDATTINVATFKLLDGAVEVAGTVSYDEGTFVATFTPSSPLDETTVYTGRITTGVKDAAGNALASQYEWSFTTSAGSTQPEVISVVPANGAVDVDAGTTVTVEFSKMMDQSTVEDTNNFKVSILDTGTPVSGTVSYNAATRKATFTPGSALADEETFKVECTSGMKDIGGENALVYFSSIFTTSAGNKWDSMKWDIGKWAP